MKVAIISDTHDNIPNTKKVLDYCQENNIEKIIHCGDLAELETFNFIKNNFFGDFFWTFGNMDIDHQNIKTIKHKNNTKIFENFGQSKIEDKQVAFVHFPEKAEELCKSEKYDFVFYGHTHKPWTEKIGKCTMLNPGNVANSIYPPTFAIWNTDDDKFDLIRINTL